MKTGLFNNHKIEKLIEKRRQLHPNDPSVYRIWEELAEIFSKDEKTTIEYFERYCKEDEAYWISEVFDDISEKLQSWKFIECLENLQKKYPDIDMQIDIDYAKKAME